MSPTEVMQYASEEIKRLEIVISEAKEACEKRVEDAELKIKEWEAIL